MGVKNSIFPGEELTQLESTESIILDNQTCVYCFIELTSEISTKEHVVGRRFVPKGTLDGEWNLIVRSCRRCNSKKSDLEDDISAITMQPSALGKHVEDDEVLIKESKRKGKRSISRFSGKPVAESGGELTLKVPAGPGIDFTFTYKSAPQIIEKRVYALALMHIKAFFYFVTYKQDLKKGGLAIEGSYPLFVSPRTDWGNEIYMAFMNKVKSWEPRWFGSNAGGYFKCAIRRHPDANTKIWSWALEWNMNYRVIGFFGDLGAAKEIIETFPKLHVPNFATGLNSWIGFRIEKPLNEKDDVLFYWDFDEDH